MRRNTKIKRTDLPEVVEIVDSWGKFAGKLPRNVITGKNTELNYPWIAFFEYWYNFLEHVVEMKGKLL